MFKTLFSLLILIIISASCFSQNKIDLTQYLNLKTEKAWVYDNKSAFSSSIDTIVLKEIEIKQKKYKYFLQDKGPMYFIDMYFIKGPFRMENDTFYYKPVHTEAELFTSLHEEVALFPRYVNFGDEFESSNIYHQKVKYKFYRVKQKIMEYELYPILGLEITTETFMGPQKDSVRLKAYKGMVEFKAVNDRKMSLREEFILLPPKTVTTGELYINSFGDTLDKIALMPSLKYQSDFSHAVYDRKGRLIAEYFYGTTGAQGVSFIVYEYGKKNRLIAEKLYYTNSYDPKVDVQAIWVNEFYYNKEGELIESRHKKDINLKDYFAIETYLPGSGITADSKRFSTRHLMRISKPRNKKGKN